LFVDQISVSPTPGPATETTDGSIAISDVETSDTHTASFTPDGSGYLGTFSLDPVTESSGSGSFAWHYSVDNAGVQFLAQGQSLVQSYSVTITDSHGATTVQDVTVAIAGSNDAPTAVNDNVIADAGASGIVDIQQWMLTANDTDPDTIDHLSVNAVGGGTGGTPAEFGDVFFFDDATLSGSFTYTNTDGHATSNSATATVTNNATSVTTLTGTSGDDIIIANHAGTLNGGGGNDILVANSAGSNVVTGGSGNDTFVFLQTTNGLTAITDFNNTTEHDHIAISASGFGGGLTAGMDVTSIFETSGDNQFSPGGIQFHFDTANQTLYYSADQTTASEIAVVTVQPGVVLNPHDLLIV
jgi:VCBS repeat-containing protein